MRLVVDFLPPNGGDVKFLSYLCPEQIFDVMKERTIEEILRSPEGRTLEFKASMPKNSDLAKTVVAFANDAGGEIIIGVDDRHRAVGVPEEALPQIEEQLSNMIYDRCYPTVLPDISFLSAGGRSLVRVRVYRGSTPPYYLKSEGKVGGTYVRVGSNNRLADEELIGELERRRRNVSFDGEIAPEKSLAELDFRSFRRLYEEKTGEPLDDLALQKLELAKVERGVLYPTNALVLLSDDGLRRSMFPNAKIECARFKGVSAGEFIDRKTYDYGIAEQVEDAYAFVLRNIRQSGSIQGVYTVSRWEYPVKALREIIRNAVVHRQYSLAGKDIKIAVYDDMIEITSPGLLPPSIDYSDMESRQSDARNKVIAPVFRKLGIIDQWGNGLKLVAEELKDYPEIQFRWREVGLSFQVQFVRKFVDDAAGGVTGYLSEPQAVYHSAREMAKDADPPFNEPRQSYRFHAPTAPEKLLLNEIAINPSVTVPELAASAGLSLRSCERLVASLKSSGILKRVGSARGGHWQIRP